MDTKGFEKKPWFPYLKNMYDEVGGDMMEVDAKGYEEKPWWPYVLDLQEKIDAGGGGGGASGGIATVTVNVSEETTSAGISLHCLYQLDIPGLEDYTYMSEDTINGLSGTATYKAPYSGDGILAGDGNAVISCSGNAEVRTLEELGETLVIYGDCVLNLKLRSIN